MLRMLTDMEEVNAETTAAKVKIAANEASVGTIADAAERISILQQISTDTARLTGLEAERRELRLQQQPQAGEYFVCV
jgi:hypothetical protein